MGAIRNVETRVFQQVRLPAPASLLGRLAFWLLLVSAVTTLGRLLPGIAGTLFFLLSLLSYGALFVVLVPLFWRYTFGRFLWKVRNRLIVTYVLMALTPVVLFVALAFIALYMFLGQFAIFAASAEMDRALREMASQNHAATGHITHQLDFRVPGKPVLAPERETGGPLNPTNHPGSAQNAERALPSHIVVFVDGKPFKLPGPPSRLTPHISEPPAWAPQHFQGIVIADGQLFMRVIDTEVIEGHTVMVINSLPLQSGGIDEIAQGLGRITIVPDISFLRRSGDDQTAPISSEAQEAQANKVRPNTVVGGTLPRARHFFDLPVNFYAPLPTTDWADGKSRESALHVTSRPTLLYERLSMTSLQVAAIVQDILIAIAIFFGLLELAAFLMAIRLNQTITRSISDLYRATLAVDSGDFSHRIAVTRKDQLAALSQSFNAMTMSVERLLGEQREKERLLGELEIAQEVQESLFPSGHVSLPTLELHGVCQPARTVSGDYYDFLVSGTSELSLALGDISGKGISAALLMATLHSAVRAYRFAGEDMRAGDDLERSESQAGGTALATEVAAQPLLAASFADPGQILGLLNRHLYRSTQPAKYATLFLAHYDGRTSELTYSTGGQPPPLLLRADDSVVRLDCGGTVIGLIDAMRYEQGQETLRPGDILIAYSDGVTEPENEFGDFGEDRLLEVVRRHRKLPLEQIAEQVLVALRNWIGDQEQPDDITLVLARQR
jgi:sigma-B regulation protein RsbU (phosphoserine phosphatase)